MKVHTILLPAYILKRRMLDAPIRLVAQDPFANLSSKSASKLRKDSAAYRPIDETDAVSIHHGHSSHKMPFLQYLELL